MVLLSIMTKRLSLEGRLFYYKNIIQIEVCKQQQHQQQQFRRCRKVRTIIQSYDSTNNFSTFNTLYRKNNNNNDETTDGYKLTLVRWKSSSCSSSTGSNNNNNSSNTKATTTTDDDNDGNFDDWIPPNRPLVGDIGQSFVYANKEEDEEDVVDKNSTIPDAEFIEKNSSIKQKEQNDNIFIIDENDNEIVQFEKELQYEIQKEEEELKAIEIELKRIDDEEIQCKLEQEKLQQQFSLSAISSNPEVPPVPTTTTTPDWLKLRRSIFGNDLPSVDSFASTGTSTASITGDDTKSNNNMNMLDFEGNPIIPKTTTTNNDIIPLRPDTLLSKKEIITLLKALGGQDIVFIMDDLELRRMGGPIGMIIVTATSYSHLRKLGDILVHYMRKRNLHQLNVIGAKDGIEGDKFKQQNWIVIDCYNYVVHVQDSLCRSAVNLESLWNGTDPLFTINYQNEDEVDKYVEDYSPSDDYIKTIGGPGGGYISKRNSTIIAGKTITSSTSSFSDTMHQLQKSRFTVTRPSNIPAQLPKRTKKLSSSSSNTGNSTNRRRRNNS